VIAVGRFRTSAPKTENGFIAQENCFVGPAGRNNGRKSSMNSGTTPSLETIRLITASRPLGRFGRRSAARLARLPIAQLCRITASRSLRLSDRVAPPHDSRREALCSHEICLIFLPIAPHLPKQNSMRSIPSRILRSPQPR